MQITSNHQYITSFHGKSITQLKESLRKMPLYQQIIVTIPSLATQGLVSLLRRHAKTVIENGGVVRGVENHGLRPLPERARRKYATIDGQRYFWEARYITSTFDASPRGLFQVERILRNADGVLRYFTLKKKTVLDRVNSTNFRNPFQKFPSRGPSGQASSF